MAAVSSIALAIGAAATVYGAYSAEETRKDAKKEAKKEEERQAVLASEARTVQARTKEIAGAEQERTEFKKTARRRRTVGGGGLLTGGDTGLMKKRLGD